MFVRCAVVIPLVFMIKHLYLNGVFFGVDLRKNASKIPGQRDWTTSSKIIHLIINTIGKISCIPKFYIIQTTHNHTFQFH